MEDCQLTAGPNVDCKSWYEQSYHERGVGAQRLYPNEELLRFFGQNYFSLPQNQRQKIRGLEAGCGSGSNLWIIAKEGFDAHGIDLSAEGLKLCEKMLAHWQTAATLKTADITAIPYPDGYFDVVLDVFSAYCLDEAGFARFLDEVARVLRAGRFFSCTPSKASDAFRKPGPARFVDSSIDGIWREDSTFFGNSYPFRFLTAGEYADVLEARGLRVTYSEAVRKTYRHGSEYFEFVVIAAKKLAA